jgi:hypothetical protein
MALKTVETNKSVTNFINSIEDESKRVDSKKLVRLIGKITGKKPKIWGDNFMIGFGKYKYKRKGGKEEFEWFNVGFAPRKGNITIYLTCYLEKEKALLDKLGKYKTGKGCLYIKKLDDVDLKVLEKMIRKNKDNRWYS